VISICFTSCAMLTQSGPTFKLPCFRGLGGRISAEKYAMMEGELKGLTLIALPVPFNSGQGLIRPEGAPDSHQHTDIYCGSQRPLADISLHIISHCLTEVGHTEGTITCDCMRIFSFQCSLWLT
jgi:hypothetical protein